MRRRRALLLLVTLALIEAVLHPLTGNFGLPAVVRHPPDGRCFGLRPDTAVPYTGMLARTARAVTHDVNALGYRGAPRPRAKTPGVLRIVVVGDSFTYGQAVEADEALPAALERELRARLDRPVEVLNFGIPGLNLEETVDQYRLFASGWEHDLVLWALNDNDMDRPICDVTPPAPVRWLVQNVRLCRLGYAAWFLAHVGAHGNSDGRIVTGVRAMDDLARSHGARLGVVMVGADALDGADPRTLGVATSERHVSLYLLPGCKRTLPRVPGDGHFSPEGNAGAAACVGEWAAEAGLIGH